MFCCGGSKCLDDPETGGHDKEKKSQRQQNQQIYIQRNGLQPGKTSDKLNKNMLLYLPKDNANLLKPDVKHVTNVRKDIYIKLNGQITNIGSSKTVGYQKSGNYKFVQVPKSHSAAVRQTSKRVPISKLNPAHALRAEKRPTEPTRDSMRLSTEFKVSSEDNRTSTPFGTLLNGIEITDDDAIAIFDNKDTESLLEEQNNALSQLEETLNNYQVDDDEETPIIIADVLPDGVFEDFRTEGVRVSPEWSEDEPSSSRTSSLNSRTGIISQGRASIGSKKNRNSVSFQLPVDHVDKPYAPMQTSSRSKQPAFYVTPSAPEETKQVPTICVTGSSMNIWHSGNTVYVENKNQRRMSGPFKGSFKSLFYGKYSNADLSGYKESNLFLAPKIMEKVTSFENITDAKTSEQFRGNPQIVRRNTFR